MNSAPPPRCDAPCSRDRLRDVNVFVVIPVHNRLSFTRACLESLREQSFRDFTIVVVDDGSTDGTYATLAEEYPEVTLLWGDGDLWWTGAMNRALGWVLPKPIDTITCLPSTTTLRCQWTTSAPCWAWPDAIQTR